MNLERLNLFKVIILKSFDLRMVTKRTVDQSTLNLNMDLDNSKLFAQILVLCAII